MHNAESLINILTARMVTVEKGYLKFEDGHEMTDAQLATMNEALGLEKTKAYRPYCLNCTLLPRVVLKPDGFECWHCGNRFGFDLVRQPKEAK